MTVSIFVVMRNELKSRSGFFRSKQSDLFVNTLVCRQLLYLNRTAVKPLSSQRKTKILNKMCRSQNMTSFTIPYSRFSHFSLRFIFLQIILSSFPVECIEFFAVNFPDFHFTTSAPRNRAL